MLLLIRGSIHISYKTEENRNNINRIITIIPATSKPSTTSPSLPDLHCHIIFNVAKQNIDINCLLYLADEFVAHLAEFLPI